MRKPYAHEGDRSRDRAFERPDRAGADTGATGRTRRGDTGTDADDRRRHGERDTAGSRRADHESAKRKEDRRVRVVVDGAAWKAATKRHFELTDAEWDRYFSIVKKSAVLIVLQGGRHKVYNRIP